MWLIHLPDQAFIHQGSQSVEHVQIEFIERYNPAGYPFDRLDRAAAGEDREQLEQALFAAVQQLIAPVDCVAQRLLPDRQVARRLPGAASTGFPAVRAVLEVKTA